MNTLEEIKSKLKSKLAAPQYAGRTPGEIARMLAEPGRRAVSVPASFTASDVLSAVKTELSDSAKSALLAIVGSQDRESLGEWAELFCPAEGEAVRAVAERTETADRYDAPPWCAQLGEYEYNGRTWRATAPHELVAEVLAEMKGEAGDGGL